MRKVRMIKGPATVVVDGTCQVLGGEVSYKAISVRAGKALPFEPSRSCRLRVRLGRGGRIWRAVPEEAGISMWHHVAQKVSILSVGKKIKVMLAGDTDTGKSTLTAYLANMAIGRRLVPCIVDGDIGQGDLAPPAGIGAAVLSESVTDLRDVNASMYEFIGNTSPAGLEYVVAKKLKSLVERAEPLGDITIINTDGYVGLQYKLMLARELKPDVIMCLGNPDLLDTFKGGQWQVLHAKASGQVIKTRYDRVSRRLDQFLRYVGNKSFNAELSQIKFAYMDRVFSQAELAHPSVVQLEPENMKGMFVGLGVNGKVTGFGIIICISRDKVTIQTNVDQFNMIYLSNIRLGGRPAEIRIA